MSRTKIYMIKFSYSIKIKFFNFQFNYVCSKNENYKNSLILLVNFSYISFLNISLSTYLRNYAGFFFLFFFQEPTRFFNTLQRWTNFSKCRIIIIDSNGFNACGQEKSRLLQFMLSKLYEMRLSIDLSRLILFRVCWN